MEERRSEDKRIEEIHSDVKEIRNVLQSENGICVRLSVNEQAVQSVQNELTEHKDVCKENKNDKFRRTDIYLSACIVVLGIIEWFKK